MHDAYSVNPSQIVMYTTSTCADCRHAKAFMEANNISFLQIGLDEDEQATRFVGEINHGFQSVPAIVFPDGAILVEPTWEELRTKFPS